MQNQRRWLPILILILIVLCLVLYFLLRPLLPIIPGTATRTSTPTSVRDLHTPTATATRTPTATPTLAPKPVWGPGNYILVRRDDYQPTTPLPTSLPALASHIDVYWDQISATGSTFNWAAIEAKVSQIATQQITLSDGRRISRPVWLTLPVFWTQGLERSGQRFCNNNVPNSVKALAPDHVIQITQTLDDPPRPLTPYTVNVPAFDDPDLLAAYRTLVMDAGRQWNNDPRIAGIIIAGGYDNETQIGANWCYVNGDDDNFPVRKWQMTAFVTGAIQAFHDAFPNKPVYLNFAPAPTDESRCTWVNLMMSYNPRHIGVGFNGMSPDVPQFVENPRSTPPPGIDCGSLELIKHYAEILPTKFEPVLPFPSGNQADMQWRYWSWLAALNARADFVDVQDAWFCPADRNSGACTSSVSTLNAVQTPNPTTGDAGFPVHFGNWIERQLGKTAATNDQLWVALRETEYPLGGTYCGSFCSGWPGDFEHYIKVIATSPASVHLSAYCGGNSCSTAGLPFPIESVYSRHAKQMQSTRLGFDVADTVHAGRQLGNVTLRLAYVDRDTSDFDIVYASDAAGTRRRLTINRQGTGAWRWATFDGLDLFAGNQLDNGADIQIEYTGSGIKP
ncbi:MAG: hypothetical protein WAV60_13360, partial [Anaerolineae bacterium]